jgi:hypothetical protein
MKWNELTSIWHRQEARDLRTLDLRAIEEALESKRRKLARNLFWRDVGEGSAGLFGAALVGVVWWHSRKVGWPFGLAMGFLLVPVAAFARERLKARRNGLSAGAPLIAKLESDIGVITHQRNLFGSMKSWYIAPVFIAEVIVTVTWPLNTSEWDPVRSPLIQGCFIIFFAGTTWFAWWGICRDVRRRLDPHLDQLRKLHDYLLSLR